ncbi:MAG: hypothetical protein HFI82_12705 [Eubacterium sp.]|jgi:hypothetical protein|nr:hypothetical protein [Eubacterium sp.]
MRKRTAYIGISYPLLYDYEHQANKGPNDLSDSPNPIIESPLGLMIFYDEILFLCKSVCPNNMRNLPYVKFVDELYPDFYFEGILECADKMENSIAINTKLSYDDIVKSLNVEGWGPDTHTHALKIGDVIVSANSNENNFLFDLNVFQALQNQYSEDIELIANTRYTSGVFNGGAEIEFIDRIIIPRIPNYIGVDGPYHECMEELRENKYIEDFRRWVIEKHNNIQRTEIKEMCVAVEKNIDEVKENIFKKYLDNNSGYSFFKSTGSTILKTTAGMLCSPISVMDAFAGIIVGAKKFLDVKSIRWQGFVMDSRNIINKIER